MSVSAHDPLGRGELQQRAVRGALWTGVNTLVSLPLAFVVNVVVARILGVADYGRLTYLTTVIAIASVIAAVGVTTALVQFGSKAHAAANPGEVRRLLSASQGFRLMVSGPIIAIAVLAIVQVDWWLLVIALVFGVAAPAALGNAQPALTIENRTDRAAQITMVGNILVQLAVVLAVLTLSTPDAVWSARVVAGGALLVLPLAVISPQYRRAVLKPSFPWRLPRAFWAFALPTGAAGIIATLVTDRTEVIFLEWFADERAMGLFGLAFGLAAHVFAPAQAFIGPLIPAVSALSAVDLVSVRRAFLRTTRAASATGGLLVVTVLPALACLVPLIYGRDFAPASDLIVIVGLGSAVMLIGSPHQAFLMARLGGNRMLLINIISLVVNVAVALALIPLIGAWGAALASAVAFIVRALQLTIGEARALGLTFASALGSLGAMLLAVAITTVMWLIARDVDLAEIPLASGVALIGAGAYVAGLKVARTGLTMGDVNAIAGALPGWLGGIGRFLLGMLRGSRAEV